jgi:NodT family efflux transporter outer membrane factor (OMF) lipoprotein
MKPTHTAALLLSALPFLPACSSGPNFERPAPPAAQAYTAADEALPPGQRLALGKRIEGDWWSLFASRPLDDLVARSLAGNYGLAAARETLSQAKEALAAQGDTLLPDASVGATLGRQKYGVALFGPSNFSIPPFTYYEFGPSLSWTPDISGAEHRRIERRRALEEYQEHQLDAAYVVLTANVVAQALEAASARAEKEAVGEIVAEDAKIVALARAAAAAGSGTRADILSAQSQLDDDRTLLPPLDQRVSLARHALAILAGKAPSDAAAPEFDLGAIELPKEIPARLPSELARTRPDILAAEANLHAASAAIGVAAGDLYPNLTLTADLMQEALSPRGLLEGAANAWSAAGGLTEPLLNRGKLTAEKREAEHAYQAALAQYRQVVLRAFGQVADMLTALAHDTEAIDARQRALDTATASLDLAQRSYQAGNTGLLPVQDAQRLVAKARLGLVRAQARRYQDTAGLFVALGGSPIPAR